ncbi:hypothetical protein M406DRAFT_70912 [Cryphonectria parasitica EP155]|uniref:Uncharacterized protein n=1 Tax=Cryphonectria parasitica (strain ATCC 38755 / EP155) TaxID=660469 RepID=A0A9P5CMW8_CRYP1|nr:uncharacterized protein M406DRAFT_70912 [Cryphonectria parasitica EP155]KAF3764553.1 hypothetical protein M406DRAFT_70912 [Cryphonectria parasitica EP155]
MVQTRKYNPQEINYVLSRIAAGWDFKIIAKAFKQDFPSHWEAQKFTAKQVGYMKGAFQQPPGTVKPYRGPIPAFPNSPTQPTSPAVVQQKMERNNFMAGNATAGMASEPQGGQNPGQQDQTVCLHYPRLLEENFDALFNNSINNNDAPFDYNDGIPNLDDYDFNLPEGNLYPTTPPGNNSAGFQASAGEDLGQPIPPLPDMSQDLASIGAQFDVDALGEVLQESGPIMDDMQPGADNPLPSIEQQSLGGGDVHEPEAVGGEVQPMFRGNGQVMAITKDGYIGIPRYDGKSAAGPRMPPHCTGGSATERDSDGVWFDGPHDRCVVMLEHRHAWDGGIHFRGYEELANSFIAMGDAPNGTAYILGISTALQVLQHEVRTTCNHELCIRARDLAQRSVNAALPADSPFRRHPLKVPQPEIAALLAEINLRLPVGYYYDPMTDMAVNCDSLVDEASIGSTFLASLGIAPIPAGQINAQQDAGSQADVGQNMRGYQDMSTAQQGSGASSGARDTSRQATGMSNTPDINARVYDPNGKAIMYDQTPPAPFASMENSTSSHQAQQTGGPQYHSQQFQGRQNNGSSNRSQQQSGQERSGPPNYPQQHPVHHQTAGSSSQRQQHYNEQHHQQRAGSTNYSQQFLDQQASGPSSRPQQHAGHQHHDQQRNFAQQRAGSSSRSQTYYGEPSGSGTANHPQQYAGHQGRAGSSSHSQQGYGQQQQQQQQQQPRGGTPYQPQQFAGQKRAGSPVHPEEDPQYLLRLRQRQANHARQG